MGERIQIQTDNQDRYKRLHQIVKNTHKEKPKAEDLESLRRYFDEDPELWRSAGNMCRRTLDHLLRTYYSQSAYVQECVTRRTSEMREELGYKRVLHLKAAHRTNSGLLGKPLRTRNEFSD